MCECFQIGGRFIAEDPDCPIHGREATQAREEHDSELEALRKEIHELRLEFRSLRKEFEKHNH